MSKALIYGVASSVAVIGASATYFFPIVENLNSFIHGEPMSKVDSVETSATVVDVNSNKESGGENQNLHSNLDNPRVVLGDDSSKKITDTKVEDNPTKTKLLEGEIPVTKIY